METKMQQSKTAGSVWVRPSYGLRASRILGTLLTVGSGSMLSYYILQILQAFKTNEAVWLKGQAVLWLLWTCLWGFQLILEFFAWQKATPEQKRAPAIGIVSLTWQSFLWQLLIIWAVMGTGQSYQVSHSPGRPMHEGASFAQYEAYFSLLLLLVWLGALVLRSRLQRAV